MYVSWLTCVCVCVCIDICACVCVSKLGLSGTGACVMCVCVIGLSRLCALAVRMSTISRLLKIIGLFGRM